MNLRESVVVTEAVRYKNAAACGQVIRDMRRERKLSLKDLSKTSGLPYQYLSRIERGEVNTPIETLTIIAQSLNVPTRQFFPSEKTVTPAQLKPLIETCPPNRLYVLYLMLTLRK